MNAEDTRARVPCAELAAVLGLAILLLLAPDTATAQPAARIARTARDAPVHARAPSPPPLPVTGERAGETVEEDQGAGTGGEPDPLVSNGLASPSCRDALAGELTATSRRHCESSGFVAAPAPTGDYGVDVHIDTGLLGFSAGGFESAVQDLLITPLWMALVWSAHAVVVMRVKLGL